jgi:hypothetical protein
MISREDVESYVSEILSRSKAIQRRCKKLLAYEFASESPLLLADTITEICLYLEDAVVKIYNELEGETENFEEEIVSDISLLKWSDLLIRYLGEHLRYIDGAITRKLPWSIIKPFEKLFQSITPGVLFMFRPQWKYNYSIVTDDLRKFYYDSLREFEDITERSRDEVFKNLKEPFHIISFPSIERINILLHCLVGHELGHLIVRKYQFIDSSLINDFTRQIRTEVNEIVLNRYRSNFEDIDLIRFMNVREEQQRSMEISQQIWKRGLEELLADIIGTFIFGPAMLFSMYELSLQKKLDHLPGYSNNFYPPWRYRLRKIIDVLQRSKSTFFPIPNRFFSSRESCKKINEKFERIESLTKEKSDIDNIEKDPLVKIAYREIEKNINFFLKSKKFLRDVLKENILAPDELYKDIEHLIIRLKNGIPPNAVEYSAENRRTATLVEIINTAWFYKISSGKNLLNEDGEINEEIFEQKETLNRLTLKAIEYSDIETEYNCKVINTSQGGEVK